MNNLIHHPDYYHTGQKMTARSLKIKNYTALTVKSAPAATQMPQIVKGYMEDVKKELLGLLPIAQSIQACLAEDLTDYKFTLHSYVEGFFLTVSYRCENIIMSNLFRINIALASNNVTILKADNQVSLTKNHDGSDVLSTEFALEDPNMFNDLAQQIKEWTIIEDKGE